MAQIFYKEVDDFLVKQERYKLLENAKNIYGVDWKIIEPDSKNNWLNEGMDNDFDSFLSLGSKEGKTGSNDVIFRLYGSGIKTNRDTWAFNINKLTLEQNIKRIIQTFGENVVKYKLINPKPDIDDFVDNDETKISWSSDLKDKLIRGDIPNYKQSKIRKTNYRPFFQNYLYFDRLLNDRVYQFPKIFPTPATEKENLVICVSGVGSSKPFHTLLTNLIPCLDILEKTQCFPFYTYNEDGTGRKENISDWGLGQFQERYSGLEDSGLGTGGLGLGKEEERKKKENNNNEIININGGCCERNQELQGFESMAGSNDADNFSLQTDQAISEGRNVCIDKSNSQSGCIDTLKHSGGSLEVFEKGIHLSSICSDGFTGRVGNTIGDSIESGLRTVGTANSDNGYIKEAGSDVRSFSKSTENESLTPNPQPQTPITKWDIFYYIYGVLHTPEYKEKYAANLRRSLPRIPFYDDFWKYSKAGKELAELHVNYEQQPEYYLNKIEAPGKQLDWKVEKMRLSKDKQTLVYNNFLTLTGIPLEAYEYKLGNRSALEWIIDQYQVKTDKRSGITNDPNRADEQDYIYHLIGKIITVSLETMKIVKGLKQVNEIEVEG